MGEQPSQEASGSLDVQNGGPPALCRGSTANVCYFHSSQNDPHHLSLFLAGSGKSILWFVPVQHLYALK